MVDVLRGALLRPNRTSRMLQWFGVRTQIVLMHQGDETTGKGGPEACSLTGDTPARLIAPRVNAFFAAHAHQAENCTFKDPSASRAH